MKYKLQIEKIKQTTMESEFDRLRKQWKRIIEEKTELKQDDFKNEAVYNTVVENIAYLQKQLEQQNEALKAARLILVAVKNGDLDVYEGNSGTDYLQILEDNLNKLDLWKI